jgi:branched-chain amino acid transport system permease protein
VILVSSVFTVLLQQLANSLTDSSIYVLLALSVTIVFGLTGIINFAVGEFMMAGAFITFSAVQLGVPFALAAAFAVLCLVLSGIVVERIFFRWTLPAPDNGFIVSLGLILILQAAAVGIYGGNDHNLQVPLSSNLHVGSIVVNAQDAANFGVAVAVMLGFVVWLYRSSSGRALRAASEDREVAALMGVPVGRLTTQAFAIGLGMAGLAGALAASTAPIQPFMSANYLLKGFIIAVVGGLGNVAGAFVVGVLVSLTEALSAQYLPISWTDGYVVVLMIIVLLFRPAGLFGVRTN